MKFQPDRYPLIIQIIDTHIRPTLLVYSPDFDFRMSEPYDSNQFGQTELLLIRMREELEKKIKLKEHLENEFPSPTKPEGYKTMLRESLLSMSEAAKILRVSRQTLWRMTQEGKIRFCETPGGHRRFLRTEIEDLSSQRLLPS